MHINMDFMFGEANQLITPLKPTWPRWWKQGIKAVRGRGFGIAGETPIVTIAPAISNALFDATGERKYSLPMVPNGLKV